MTYRVVFFEPYDGDKVHKDFEAANFVEATTKAVTIVEGYGSDPNKITLLEQVG